MHKSNPCDECVVQSMCKRSCDPLVKFSREFVADLGLPLTKYQSHLVANNLIFSRSMREFEGEVNVRLKSDDYKIIIRWGEIRELSTKSKKIKRVLWRKPKR